MICDELQDHVLTLGCAQWNSSSVIPMIFVDSILPSGLSVKKKSLRIDENEDIM